MRLEFVWALYMGVTIAIPLGGVPEVRLISPESLRSAC
jgi:hypothetical protein